MDLHHFKHHCAFNEDGTGVVTVQTKQSKVLALKVKKISGMHYLCRKRRVMYCSNSGGGYVPPGLIFSRQHMKPELLDGTSPGTGLSCHPCGWMQLDIFTTWFEQFLSFVKPNENNPAL